VYIYIYISLLIFFIIRPVLRDLARILVLVNRRDDEIPLPPDDWQRLFSWAERLLRRYKRHSSPEVRYLFSWMLLYRMKTLSILSYTFNSFSRQSLKHFGESYSRIVIQLYAKSVAYMIVPPR